MATRRTVDLLPEIFRTDTNKKFLSATLDQLTQEPNFKRAQGYAGRRVGPGVNPADSYITEPSAVRSDYQLEPGVVFLKPDTNTAIDAITYPGIIDALTLQGAEITRQDVLFGSEYYTWDPFCDLDKFTNYSQYYWLPAGPDSADLFGTDIALTDSWTVTRVTNAYEFSDIAENNPILTLVRGGNYEFIVNQPGFNFWIQAAPGISGTMPATPNISSRDVLGVVNNGEDQGTVTFNVPLKNAQDFYYTLSSVGSVDLITSLKFNQLNNVYVSEFLSEFPTGIDGITSLNGRTIVFTNDIVDAQDGGWQITTQFDPLLRDDVNNGSVGSYDTTTYDQTSNIDLQSQRYSIWQIQYINDQAGNPFMRLSSITAVPNLSKFNIKFGTQYASTQWYKNASGYFEQIPLLTAILDTVWYQDSANPSIFGQIKLVDPGQDVVIDINDIIGARNYTSPNGVVFTNGLKVQFRGTVTPPQFQNLEYYVEGVGTGLGIDLRVGFVDGEAYFGAFHVYQGQKMTGSVHSTTTFQQYIYDTIEESSLNTGAGGPAGAALPIDGTVGATVGNGIRLLPVSNFVTPETYTQSLTIPYDSTSYDSTTFDSSLNAPEIQDYLTINRASHDRNAWSRSNRWFHIDVIRATAVYNNQVLFLDNSLRAKRPIIEFRANLDLYNFGTQGKNAVNIIDFTATDAFSNINGQTSYNTDGYTFINGSRVVFAADVDPEVRNRIYEVQFIDPNNSGTLIIDLIPTVDSQVLPNQTTVVLSGITQQGKSYWFTGEDWILAQQKTQVNQAPLFDIFDSNGISFSNTGTYPSSSFAGSKLFGYALGTTQITDDVLGFSLRFLNINNVGDIVFENYLYTDSFIYVRDNVSFEQAISTGFIRQYIDRVTFSNLIGWQTAAAESRSRQVFSFVYDQQPLQLDIPVDTNTVFPPLQLFIEGQFVEPSTYVYEVVDSTTVITLLTSDLLPIATGTIIEVQALSNQTSSTGFYQVPLNLENNPLNENSGVFTLGTIRTHYETIGQNLRTIQGPVVGANNTRDLGNIIRYGDLIVQNSAPIALTGVFLREKQFELFSAMEFNSREYSKYKAQLLDLVANGDFENNTPTEILDSVLQELSLGRSNISPFYWSDMLPAGETYTENSYTYSVISTPTFDTLQTYDFTSSNYLGLLVYLNGILLTIDYDYTVAIDAPNLTITAPLAVGDVITIREYPTTYGSYVPNTPTKLGLYPAYKPDIYEDTTYITPRTVIRGHDGSITLAFSDYRDQVLLEFEKRIFDNLKIKSLIPLNFVDVVPGQFRTTDFTLSQVNDILSKDFLSWVGWNKLDYTEQNYLASNPFTYNYSQSANKLTRQPVAAGAWRGLYNYFYDTYTPDSTPWEMLGLTQKPSWWEEEYGPAPYTSGNTVLWDDLAAGIIREPGNTRIDPGYVRPELLQVLPVGSEGELLDPLQSVIGNYDITSFRRSWTFGDDGPVENAWRTSSAWPFAVMRLLALTKPAKFFSLFSDRDRYVYNDALEQFLWDDRYRLDATKLTPLYGNGVSKASYLDWIIDYNRQLGINSTDNLTITLNNIDVRLCWRVAGFTDKNYLKIYTERSTPGSTNSGLILPDESYQLLLYKNQPFEQVTYSSVIVQKVDTGWAVLGYSTQQPFFNILVSRVAGQSTVISVAGNDVRVAVEHTDNVVQVPYGYVFTNLASVCDFLVSYGALLQRQGLVFETRENGYILDWFQMCQEFLYWSQQGWATGSIINLNPAAVRISVERPQAVVDSILTYSPNDIILNQNRQPLPLSDLVIDRIDNLFRVTSLSNNTINYLNLRFTAYEHMVVLDNRSIFADLIYDRITGSRQSRVLISGWITNEWTGLVNAPGFVLNQDNIIEWTPTRKYAKGDIVLFKNEYWSASTVIQPSQNFNYNLWIKSDYNQIQKGLLPNAANASDQLSQAYSVYDANLEQEVDLFSYGLIGFRPRQYMEALNLDDVSQVNLYQQFLGTKGTIRSAELFSLANLGKETATYDINEYWAVLRSTYGATANQSFIDLRLNEALLHSNPCLIQVVQPQQESEADQTVLLENVWKSSVKLSSTNIFPTTLTLPTDAGLPSAGYVNFDDVDLNVFDFETLQLVPEVINNIGVGTTLWVAKVNSYEWNVYRCSLVPGDIVSVTDNLNARALVTFTKPHNLVAGDILIIRFFDNSINGLYVVRFVTGITTLLIDLIIVGEQTTFTGTGVGFTLQSSRVAQPSDIVNLPYARQLQPGVKVWVDNNGADRWTVLEKTDPFAGPVGLVPFAPVENSKFGASISQGFQNLGALVGAPGYNVAGSATAPGAVYTYVKNDQDLYEENGVLELGTTNTAGYGNASDIGDQSWAIVGASASANNRGYAVVIYNSPSSNIFEQWQLLLVDPAESVTAADEFGRSVTMSRDEYWIYVGAPGGNRVYAYSRIDYQNQIVNYITDGNQVLFNYSNEIVVDTGDQLAVSLDNEVLTLGVDYTTNGIYVILPTPPNAGLKLTIARRSAELFVGDGSTSTYSLANIYSATLYTPGSIGGAISVYVDNVLQRLVADYDYDPDSSQDLIFVTPPAANAIISVRASTYYTLVDTIAVAGLNSTDKFGHSVTASSNGRQVIIGCPDATYTDPVTGNVLTQAGSAYVFDRSVQNFQVTDATVLSYTTELPLVEPTQVLLNGVFLLNKANNIGGTYSISGSTITLDTEINVGDTITVETNQFNLLQTINSATPQANAEFGFVVDQCINDCSLYIGAPYANSQLVQSGQVEFNQNQARVYGSITSNIANPAITTGDFIRVNNYFVEATGTTVAQLAEDINAAAIPNAQANVTANLEFIGNAATRIFDVGTIYSSVLSYTTVVLIDTVEQTAGINYTYNNTTQQITFTTAPASNAVITIVSGRLTISAKNIAASQPLNRLQVLPGTGTLFEDLSWDVYANEQVIVSPIQQEFANFGKTLFISENTTALLVGAPNGSLVENTIFDAETTTFDATSTAFFDTVTQSGVVYSYDALPSANGSVTNPLQFVFGQQIYNPQGNTLDEFGAGIDYTTGTLLIGSPGLDLGDSQDNNGQVFSYRNFNLLPAWSVLRLQQPVVDVSLLNTIFMYDRAEGYTRQYFDYLNPLQGRLLGAVSQNLDFIGAVDPAAYNNGSVNNYGSSWREARVGQIWWNTTDVRFIDPNQDNITYASRRWGQVFPGSTLNVYQWISSSVPPIQYAGPGTPFALGSYSTSTSLNEQGILSTEYYFWVAGISTVNIAANKTLSTAVIAQYIESPSSSGISYIAPINSSTIAIYNGLDYISAQDTILQVSYDQQLNDDAVHVEYQLVAQDRADGFLADALYNKLQDSFCGVDVIGRPVPDPFLNPSEQYGTEARPRQSMFVNRFLALKNYLGRANTILRQYPIVETRRFSLLDSEEPEPSTASGAWDFRVANYEELTYQNLNQVPLGYKYLVASDSTNNGLWTIYQVIAGDLLGSKTFLLIRVQNYDTKLYWNHIDWYLPGYDPLTRILAEVPVYSSLSTLSVPLNSVVKVSANGQGKWELYQLINTETATWLRVGLQDGTIEFPSTLWDYSIGRYGFDIEVFDAQFFDQEPVIETRKIIQAINEELFIDDLLIERNRALILMFNYILSEQQAPTWLTKTSLIDVDHVIRNLEPFQIYRRDNQDFVLNYIQEVKPYHVQIREFNLIYNGFDRYNGTVNDFDLPAFYDNEQALFISPILDDSEPPVSTTSSLPSTNAIWQTLPWNQWYQNYLLSIQSVAIADPGTGYTVPPEVVVTGAAVTPAVMTSRINTAGEVIAVDVIDPGFGYTTTAIISFVGGNGTGAQAVAAMGGAGKAQDFSVVPSPVEDVYYNLARTFLTVMKYDRYEYQTTIVDWQPNVNYENGTQVRYFNKVWAASSDDSTGVENTIFDTEQWTLVPAADLSGVDRTMGYYTPRVNEPGLDLALLISGVDYPGVQVSAPGFNQNTGFDVGNFDISPFDNISYGPEGRPTYDPAILDAIYASEFIDPFLGTLPSSINVDGGGFVDTYSSYAPEELVPGAIFDTLDMRVFTTPGSDWDENGHGFPEATKKYIYTSLLNEFAFSGLLEYPITIAVWNQTQGVQLLPVENYTVDWVAKTITVNSGAVNNDTIVVTLYALGGGNQLFTRSYIGNQIGNTVVIPVQFSLINELVIFVNGELVTNYTSAVSNTFSTQIIFSTTYTDSDYIVITAMGIQSPQYSWSTPQTQYFVADGINFAYTLTNSLEGTNPANIVVEKNGIRARPAEGIEYIDDGSSLQYYLPTRGGYSQALISNNDVSVYVNNEPLILGVGFVVDPYDDSSNRTVTLTSAPPAGATILISVRTAAQYYISGGTTLVWNITGPLIPIAGDIISVTTFNDTSEQNILTQVFVGPNVEGVSVSEGYDVTDYDVGLVAAAPGSFDFSTGIIIENNKFDTGRIITDSSRLSVTLDGYYLFPDNGFTVDGSSVTITGPAINASQVVAITSVTQSVVPGAIAFRIFQDMRGLQSTYRITNATTTVLAQALQQVDDIIYVENAAALSEPNLPLGIFGLITINGERIAYRNRDTVNNTVSGLRRGTAGTAADSHSVGTSVYDIGAGNLLPLAYQNYIVSQEFLANGTQTIFATDNIVVDGLDSTELVEAVEVYVGGILQTSGYSVTGANPVTVAFGIAPTANYQVSIVVKRGLSWYEPGSGTASNGIALQEQQTSAARFIRGN
jgi:hypothetical protein